MASSSANSSGSDESRGGVPYSPPEDGIIDERKRKRMESNRESARRSRMRKQKYIGDLIAEASKIKNDNDQIRTTINVTTQQFVEVETENSVLRAQIRELSQRIDSLNGILNSINGNANCTTPQCVSGILNSIDTITNGNCTTPQCVSGILNSIDTITNGNCTTPQCVSGANGLFEFDYVENPWNMMYINHHQPIIASAVDMFGY